MARSLDQISTDLAKLETATEEIDQDLQAVYQEYFTVLGQAVKRQLILAAYHLCTQAYPEDFVALTVAQREKLQAHLRQIATQGQTQILQLGKVTDFQELATRLEAAVAAKFSALESELDSDSTDDEPAALAPAEDAEAATTTTIDLSEVADAMMASEDFSTEAATPDPEAAAAEPDTETKMAEAATRAAARLKRLGSSLSLFSILGADPLTPVSLAKRHVLLERHLRAVLQTLSGTVNYLFKQSGILPDLPEMVIAAATEAEGSESGPSTPNLVSVLVEMGNRPDVDPDVEAEADVELDDDDFEEDDADRDLTYLVALNLRLADIEFADHHVALWRSRLQETLKQLKRLGSRYQKLQQEKAQAEAEHAWRATWFED